MAARAATLPLVFSHGWKISTVWFQLGVLLSSLPSAATQCTPAFPTDGYHFGFEVQVNIKNDKNDVDVLSSEFDSFKLAWSSTTKKYTFTMTLASGSTVSVTTPETVDRRKWTTVQVEKTDQSLCMSIGTDTCKGRGGVSQANYQMLLPVGHVSVGPWGRVQIRSFKFSSPKNIELSMQEGQNHVHYYLAAISNGANTLGVKANPAEKVFRDSDDPAVGEYVLPVEGVFDRLRIECGYQLDGVHGFIELEGAWRWQAGSQLSNQGTPTKLRSNMLYDPNLPGYTSGSATATNYWNNAKDGVRAANFGVTGFEAVDGQKTSTNVWACKPNATGDVGQFAWGASNQGATDTVQFVRLWLGNVHAGGTYTSTTTFTCTTTTRTKTTTTPTSTTTSWTETASTTTDTTGTTSTATTGTTTTITTKTLTVTSTFTTSTYTTTWTETITTSPFTTTFTTATTTSATTRTATTTTASSTTSSLSSSSSTSLSTTSSSSVSSTTSRTSSSSTSKSSTSTTSRSSSSSTSVSSTSSSSSSSTSSVSSSSSSTSSVSSSSSSSSTSSSSSSSSSSTSRSSTSSTFSSSTTTFTRTLPTITGVPAMLEVAGEWEGGILDKLKSLPEKDSVTMEVPGATMVAFRVGAKQGDTSTSVPGTGASITVPASVSNFTGLETLAAVGTVFEDGLVGQVRGMASGINLNLFTFGAERIPVNETLEPFVLTIPVSCSNERALCSYWDEEAGRWSQEGLTLLGMETNSTTGCAIRCATTHLSLFGAIWAGFLEAILCTQIHLFDPENMRQLFVGDWFLTTFAMLFWLVLLIVLSLCLGSCYMDHKHKGFGWDDEYFLIPLEHLRTLEEEGEAPTPVRQRSFAPRRSQVKRTAALIFAPCTWCLGSSACRDALDDICSRWFSYFGEFRDLCEAMADGLFSAWQGRGSSTWGTLIVGSLVANNARRQACASLGLSADVVNFVLDDEDLGMLLGEAAHASATSGRSWDKRLLAWRHLHETVLSKIDSHWHATHYRSIPDAFSKLFVVTNPVGSIFLHCRLLPHSSRVLFFSSELLGSFMVAALFFEGTGTVSNKRNRGDCSGNGGIGSLIGRILAIAVTSAIIGGIPVLVLSTLPARSFKKLPREGCPEWTRQLEIWKINDRIMWTVGIVYNFVCIFFISLFLANIDPADLGAWGLSILIQITEEEVVIPVSVAILVPATTTMALRALAWAHGRNWRELLRERRAFMEENGTNWKHWVIAI